MLSFQTPSKTERGKLPTFSIKTQTSSSEKPVKRRNKIRKSVIFRIINSVTKDETSPLIRSNKQKKSLSTFINHLTEKEPIPKPTSFSNSSRNQKMKLLSSFSKENKIKRVLPFLTTLAAMNKYLIREYKDEPTKDYIKNTKKQVLIANNFFEQYKAKKKKRSALLIDNFEKAKHLSIFDNNISRVLTTIPSNKSLSLTERKKTSKIKSRNGTLSSIKEHYDIVFYNSEAEYKEVKDQHEALVNTHIKNQGLSLANMILNMNKNEEVNLNDDNINHAQNSIILTNLKNTIYLRKLLKKRNEIKEGDEDLGIGDVERMITDRKDTEYKMAKAMKTLGSPKFLKNKFYKTTLKQFKGVSGKYFGVVC